MRKVGCCRFEAHRAARCGARLAALILALVWAAPDRAAIAAADQRPTSTPASQATASVTEIPPELLRACPPDSDALDRLAKQLGWGGLLSESDHFVVRCTAGDGALNAGVLGEGVYLAHARLAAELGLPMRPLAHKLEAVLFAERAEFVAFVGDREVPADLFGYYDPDSHRCAFLSLGLHPDVVAIGRSLADKSPSERKNLRLRIERRLKALELTIMQHEFAHQVEFNTGWFPDRGAPTWVTEGLATLFEVPLDYEGQSLQNKNAYRLYEFRKLYASAVTDLGDLRHFLSDDDAWAGGASYPLAYAVMRYLRAEYPAAFGEMLRDIAAKKWPAKAEARAQRMDALFGPIDVAWVQRFYDATLKVAPRAENSDD